MKVIIFGATGMVGQSVLRECIVDDIVQEVLTVGRQGTGQHHEKLKEIVLENVAELSSFENEIIGFDACFFCLGVSSAGMKEEEYRKITYDITLSVAETLVRLNSQMTFIYVSGSGTDSSEKGRIMWARVKGKTENDLLRLPFKRAYMFRPGGIIPMHGVKSKTKWYQYFYIVMRPLNHLFMKSSLFISSEQLGRAMIKVARDGYSKSIIESSELKHV
ncbi:NAD-dependent epimerase/dehydratase family protein [Paenibacillus sp. P46E]|uniref:NAD-dependent epimerase/dehydratase family protein n=1 Tax=Paenibacillus sp. P46E TaxID=1349436 RepID=UPI0009395527|nr:NAD-dependent epimerase/dehydratase family protein [Paenibacillus sp. P46E]OKP95308.1 epimerase [Paenibacillus sp. P46E]